MRTFALACAAAAAIALGALASNPAAARDGHNDGGRGHGWHNAYGGMQGGGRHHGGWHGQRFSGGQGGCYVRRMVPTPWGPRLRVVNRCH